MDRLDMAEKLANKAGVTLGEAKAALEKADWDMLEAMILLQKEKKMDGKAQAQRANKGGDKGFLAKAIGWIGDLVARGNRNYIAVSRDGKPLFELTVTVAALLGILLHGFFLFGVVVMLLMGFRFAFISEAQDKAYRREVSEAGDAAREVNDRDAVNSFGGRA